MGWHDEREPPVYAPGERTRELEGGAARMNTTKLRRALRLAKRHGVLVAFREWYRFHMSRGYYSRDMACDIALWDLEIDDTLNPAERPAPVVETFVP